MPKAITAATLNKVGILTSIVASPSRSLRAASAMAQAPISGNAMIWAGVWKAERPPFALLRVSLQPMH